MRERCADIKSDKFCSAEHNFAFSSLQTGNVDTMLGDLKDISQFSPAARMLAAGDGLSKKSLEEIEKLQTRQKSLSAGDHVIRVGDMMDHAYVLRKGWIARQRNNADGRTHITNIYLPGDFFSVHLSFVRWALYDFVALTDCEVSVIASQDLAEACQRSPELNAALDWNAIRTLNTISEYSVGIALRRPTARIMHILLEFWCRLMLVSEADETGYHLPLTQAKIGELCGLSIVTTNRALRELREAGLLEVRGRWISFPNPQRAFELCSFDGKLVQPFTPTPATRLEQANVG